MKTVYAHINNTNKLDSIKGLCAKLNIRIESVGNNDLDRPILNIVSGDEKLNVSPGISTTSNIPPMYNMPEVLIFQGFDEPELKYFLSEYKSAGIEKVALKAMVTPYNLVWTLYDLIEHLKEENAQLG